LYELAKFEELIRQALARHNSADPHIRERVYRASRNALDQMNAANPSASEEEIRKQREMLESSIRRIEAGYAAEAAKPPEQPAPTATRYEVLEETGDDWDRENDDFPYEADFDDDLFLEEDDRVQPSGNRRRTWAVAATAVLLIVVGWLLYSLIAMLGGTPAEVTGSVANSAEPGEIADAGSGGTYFTILSPTDTTGLHVAGRGTAEIINQSNLEIIRLTSVRQDGLSNVPADPIMLAVGPGIVDRIAGQRVTVEILARSGTGAPATFAINCAMGNDDACGRKRFRVGLQPEAIVFTMNMPAALNSGDDPHFGISTDVTSSAGITGQGDSIDILYARLRLADAG
jgi:hypothetical protein